MVEPSISPATVLLMSDRSGPWLHGATWPRGSLRTWEEYFKQFVGIARCKRCDDMEAVPINGWGPPKEIIASPRCRCRGRQRHLLSLNGRRERVVWSDNEEHPEVAPTCASYSWPVLVSALCTLFWPLTVDTLAGADALE